MGRGATADEPARLVSFLRSALEPSPEVDPLTIDVRLPPKADIGTQSRDVRFVPIADIDLALLR